MKTWLFLLLVLSSMLTVQAEQQEWRTPSPDNLVYVELEEGLVIIELSTFSAPNHVKRFKNLVNEGFYDGLDFYRVIDGFVAQGGDVTESKKTVFDKQLIAEFTHTIPANTHYLPVQKPDFMAPETGFYQGFPVGRDSKSNEQWMLHCPGTLAFGRNNGKDTASSEIYIVIGQATRHLDRNMSSVGRVIYGMDAVQKVQRAHINNASGVIEDKSKRSLIKSMKMANKVSKDKLVKVQVQADFSNQVNKRLNDAKGLVNDFFHYKEHKNLDICYYNLKSRVKP